MTALYESALEVEPEELAHAPTDERPTAAGGTPFQLVGGNAQTALAARLAQLDPAARATVVNRIQQGHGNAFVQRLARAAREDEHPHSHAPCKCGGGATCRCHEHKHSNEHELQRQDAETEEVEEPWEPPPWSPIEGEGEPRDTVHEAKTVKIKGLTHGNFDGGKFKTIDKVSKGEGCEGCKPKECTTVSGTVESTFTANPKVTLPKVSDFPDLTPCQKALVQDAIDNKIAPHEQEHVTRFKTYSGSTSIPFSVTGCRSELRAKANAVVDKIHLDENKRRGDAADALSAAIDPFEVHVDLNCKEPEKKAAAPGGAEPEPTVG